MDVCRRRSCANENAKENFWTLEPDVPFTLVKMNFRPYGDLSVKNPDWAERRQKNGEREVEDVRDVGDAFVGGREGVCG